MRTCRELVEFIHAYLTDELDADQRATFEEHLRLCPPCVDYLESYKECVDLEKWSFEEATPPAEAPPEALIHAILFAVGKPHSCPSKAEGHPHPHPAPQPISPLRKQWEPKDFEE
jgi:anti-sigma factor RsiW